MKVHRIVFYFVFAAMLFALVRPVAAQNAGTEYASASGGHATVISRASEPETCEGLNTYRSEMFAAARTFLNALDDGGLRETDDTQAFSADDWRLLADQIDIYVLAMRDIDPPRYAVGWHQAVIEAAVLGADLSRAIADDGSEAIEAFRTPSALSDRALQLTLSAAIRHCPDFEQFQLDWDAMDDDTNGTPVATQSA